MVLHLHMEGLINPVAWRCFLPSQPLPGFGELEEYFLPREIGEITGQAKVPFGRLDLD